MKTITVHRFHFTDKCTIGKLLIDGNDTGLFTLEDCVRTGPKVPGETAIPTGCYKVDLTFSNRFQRELPILRNVPGFEGIRIHSGNTSTDTSGCILVGKGMDGKGGITQSKLALFELMEELEFPCEIVIEGMPPKLRRVYG